MYNSTIQLWSLSGRVTSLNLGIFQKFRKIPEIAGDLHNYQAILSNRLEHHWCEDTEADYTHELVCVHVQCHDIHHNIKRQTV